MKSISEVFGKKVFNDAVMKLMLPPESYRALKKHMEEGTELEPAVADSIAAVMKDWAIEHGATHFTHWFQPMTGITAEKHDSFLSPAGDGTVMMHFSGKELIKGEPDASSFPSGGIRATFEARGYTAWDPSSYVFIKGRTLCIPTAFCSYGGEALDKKTPLLLSIETISRQSCRVLAALGKKTSRVIPSVGPEQEYFLIPEELYKQRKDLRFCGRTLFGTKPPKSQELDDHYFGVIKPEVEKYMEDLNEKLWELGVQANTEHNEVAPSQHELAPIFSNANLASDHNQLTMEVMKKTAKAHGLVCLLHEKPFAGINGSGKHINWSLATEEGENLLKPGKNPAHNIPFLLFLSAVIKGVDEYQDLMRISVASAGNDHRLGGSEAPPAIISMFLGDDLTEILDRLECGSTLEESSKVSGASGSSVDSKDSAESFLGTRATVLPDIKQDTTDRNRTSPFAFTGNRFEFRMPGSETSVSCPVYMLNTIVAEELRQFADRLEETAAEIKKSVGNPEEKKQKMTDAAIDLIRSTYRQHKRIVFNGNNYSDEWVRTAHSRGLLNLPSTADALAHFTEDKNLTLFARHGIFSEAEIRARQVILYEEYAKTLNIEALTLLDMIHKEILPAVSRYTGELAESAAAKNQLLGSDVSKTEEALISRLSSLSGELHSKTLELSSLLSEAESLQKEDAAKSPADAAAALARHYRDQVVPVMESVRVTVDELEQNTASDCWPFPTYGELLFA